MKTIYYKAGHIKSYIDEAYPTLKSARDMIEYEIKHDIRGKGRTKKDFFIIKVIEEDVSV